MFSNWSAPTACGMVMTLSRWIFCVDALVCRRFCFQPTAINVKLFSSNRDGDPSVLSVEEDKQRATILEDKQWRDFRKEQRYGHDQWRPKKRLTWYQIDHLKALRNEQPEKWTPLRLANTFGVSVSSVLRILRSKFDPPAEVKERQDAKALEYKQQKQTEAEGNFKRHPYDEFLDH